jgi:hypothetical protein
MAKDPKPDKTYEVIHTLHVARNGKSVAVNRGGEVKASELGEDVEKFLGQGLIADPEAAVSIASLDLAHDRLTAIALHPAVGLVTRSGAVWQFGAKKFSGVTAYRAGVTHDELQNAITGAFEALRKQTEAKNEEGE